MIKYLIPCCFLFCIIAIGPHKCTLIHDNNLYNKSDKNRILDRHSDNAH